MIIAKQQKGNTAWLSIRFQPFSATVTKAARSQRVQRLKTNRLGMDLQSILNDGVSEQRMLDGPSTLDDTATSYLHPATSFTASKPPAESTADKHHAGLNSDVVLSPSSMEEGHFMEANSSDAPPGSLEDRLEGSEPPRNFGQAKLTVESTKKKWVSEYNKGRNSKIVTVRCEISFPTDSSALLLLPSWALVASNSEQLLERKGGEMSLLAKLLSGKEEYPKPPSLKHDPTENRMRQAFPAFFSPGMEDERTAFFNWLAESIAEADLRSDKGKQLREPAAEVDRVIPPEYLDQEP
ncbi:hypothetical protein QFC19_001454 [Naganishia cerealis]|uniref:Uncharacterized protein n=1 Tax=Naganishia cerealis TaxID=610337 RepID=A0ACC2WHJ5_9TREE|nr:hypothetical protein QFC19_001454 [Naganishia cerealis]